LTGVPHVVVRVNESLYERTCDEIEAIARAQGFEGRIVVLSESDVAPGDCRIEWADGGISRDQGKTDAAILEAVEKYLTVRRGAAPSA
jgi:flagellar assembly protein FliH